MPHRIDYLEQLYDHILGHDRVRVWTGETILPMPTMSLSSDRGQVLARALVKDMLNREREAA